MNKTRKSIVSVILIFSLLLTVITSLIAGSNISLASESIKIGLSEKETVQGNSIIVNSINEDTIKEGTKLIYENEEGAREEFTAILNQDSGMYYLDIKLTGTGVWKPVKTSSFENSEFLDSDITVYGNLEEMTGYKDGFIDTTNITDSNVSGEDLSQYLSKVKGYEASGKYSEVTATINSGVFTIYNEGLSSTVSSPDDFTLAPGKYTVSLKNSGYSTEISINLTSEYTTVIEEEPVQEQEVKARSFSAPQAANTQVASSAKATTATARYSGTNRYETAVEVSKSKYTTADNVVIINGESPTDMSAAAPFAKQKNAPILLTNKNSLPASTSAEISRLKAKNVYVIGGEGSVTASVFNQLKNKGISTSRIWGANGYDTSVAVSNELLKITNRGTVVIISGDNYYDSLSAASFAASKGYPIICVGYNRVPPSVSTAIKNGKFSNAVIVGGPGTVSTSVESTIKSNIKTVTRVSGNNRYETSLAIATKYFSNSKIVNIASGETYADALPGAAVSGVNDSPIVVVSGNQVSSSLKSYLNNIKELKAAYIYGGTGSVSTAFESSLKTVVNGNSSGGGNTKPPVTSNISILLDPGHAAGSAHNRGYLSNTKWKNEGDGNYQFSLLLKKELEAYGIKVTTTRPTNTSYDIPLHTRGQSAKGYNLLLSLHTNAGGGTGVEIYNDTERPGAERLATNLTGTVSKSLDLRNRGVKERFYGENTSGVNPKANYYGVLRSNAAPAGMLIEHCFHDNATDISRYEARATTLAKNMAATIASYYGLK